MAKMLTAAIIAVSFGQANAMLAPPTSGMEGITRSQDMQKVQSFLERKEVTQHLSHLKLSPSEIELRLGSMSDQELHQVATRIDHQQVGRDGGGIVVTVLVIGILALLFVYLLRRV